MTKQPLGRGKARGVATGTGGARGCAAQLFKKTKKEGVSQNAIFAQLAQNHQTDEATTRAISSAAESDRGNT